MATNGGGGRRSLIAWLGDHVFGAVLSTIVALVAGAWVVTETSPLPSAPDQVTTTSTVSAKVPRVNRDSWPDGATAWTVVLASAATPGLAEAALAQARRISSRGLNLGVLRSDDYVGLRPGYWVAFAGQFDAVEEAQREAGRYSGQFPTAYQRFIEER